MFIPITTTITLPHFDRIQPRFVRVLENSSHGDDGIKLYRAENHRGDFVFWDANVYDRLTIMTYAEAYNSQAAVVYERVRDFKDAPHTTEYCAVIDGHEYKRCLPESGSPKNCLYTRDGVEFSPTEAEIKSILSAVVRDIMAANNQPEMARVGFTPDTVKLTLESSDSATKRVHHCIKGFRVPRPD